MGILGSLSDNEVSKHCRIVCAISLQWLKELLSNVWAFSIATDAGNNSGSAYLDLRVRFYLKGNLHNFHLLAIPMRESHTGAYQYNLVVKAFDVLVPDWRHKLIGVSSDGASAMTGCIQGTVTRLQQESHHSIFRIWCGAHQLDLVIKKAFNGLMDERFLTTLSGVTGHLRRQQNLLAEMKSTCPLFVNTRSISMGKVLKWLKVKRMRLLQHVEEKKPLCTPSVDWWLMVFIIQPMVERAEETFVALQGMNTLVCEQAQQLTRLQTDIMMRCNIQGPLSDHEKVAYLDDLSEDQTAAFVQGDYGVKRGMLRDAINETSAFVCEKMDSLFESNNAVDKDTHDRILGMIARFGLEIADGTNRVVAERDNQNGAGQQRLRLVHAGLDIAGVEKIDELFRQLRLEYRENSGFKQQLVDCHMGNSGLASFAESWKPLGKEYDELKKFCGGIASVMPTTATVEGDFSLINWTKDPFSRKLTDFSLEAILHCK